MHLGLLPGLPDEKNALALIRICVEDFTGNDTMVTVHLIRTERNCRVHGSGIGRGERNKGNVVFGSLAQECKKRGTWQKEI